jgi:hypothetical protein
MAQVSTKHFVKFDSIFDRPLDSTYNDGGIDTYRMCEWGIMKRAVEANTEHLRPRKIVALGASMSSFAIVVARDSKAYEPEMLKNVPIAGHAQQRLALHDAEDHGGIPAEGAREDHDRGLDAQAHRGAARGQGRGGEPDGAVDQLRAEAGPQDPGGVALDACRGRRGRPRRRDAQEDVQRQARAVELIEKDPRPYVKYLVAETGGLLEPHEFQHWRLLHAPPQPYTRERWEDTYNWTVGWNMTVPGATFENTVDNRAWE